MATIRIRLCFTPDLLKKCFVSSEQCWMLVDRTCCKFVYDLEYLVKKKFFEVNKCLMLSLYLDNCLLPSKEKIEIIRDNDVISVKEDKASMSPLEKSAEPCVNGRNPKKRKLDSSIDSTRNAKKMKHSATCRADREEKTTKGEKLKDKHKKTTSETEVKTSTRKSKCQRAVKFLQKVSQEVSNKISGSENIRNKNEQSDPKRKHDNSNVVRLKPLQSTTEKQRKNSNTNQVKVSVSVKSSEVMDKTGHKILNKNVPRENRIVKCDAQKINKDIVEHKSLQKSDSSLSDSSDSSSSESSLSDGPLPLSSKNNNVQRDNKTPLRSSASVTSATSATLSDRSSPPKGSNVVQKNTSNYMSGKNKLQTTNNKNVNGAVVSCKDKPGFQHSHSNHIRFDDNDTGISLKTPSVLHDTGSSKPQIHPPILPPPNISSVRQTKTLLNAQSPQLSPIHPISTTKNYENGEVSSGNRSKKDVYTHKSIILESTRVEKQPQKKDFFKYPVLHGPPRIGETVVYKILELSQSYTPEISKYKEGKVLGFCPNENKLKLKLTKESLLRAQGDGRVSFKFELFEINEEDGEPIIPITEIPDEVDVLWTDMIEPRLVTPGN